MCPVAEGAAVVIRIDEIWLVTEPLDMRAGPDTALAQVVKVFGSARPHCAGRTRQIVGHHLYCDGALGCRSTRANGSWLAVLKERNASINALSSRRRPSRRCR